MSSTALSRSPDRRIIAGVCGGLATRWGRSATLVRALFLLSCLIPGPQFLIYIALWIILPKAAPAVGTRDWR